MNKPLIVIALILCYSAYGQSDTSVPISLKLHEETIDVQKGISANAIRGTLTAEVIFDENSSKKPKDVTYRIEGLEVYLKSGSAAKMQAKSNTGSVSIGAFPSASPKKGDFLVVKVTAISIINSEGLKESISTRGMVYSIELY